MTKLLRIEPCLSGFGEYEPAFYADLVSWDDMFTHVKASPICKKTYKMRPDLDGLVREQSGNPIVEIQVTCEGQDEPVIEGVFIAYKPDKKLVFEWNTRLQDDVAD